MRTMVVSDSAAERVMKKRQAAAVQKHGAMEDMYADLEASFDTALEQLYVEGSRGCVAWLGLVWLGANIYPIPWLTPSQIDRYKFREGEGSHAKSEEETTEAAKEAEAEGEGTKEGTEQSQGEGEGEGEAAGQV